MGLKRNISSASLLFGLGLFLLGCSSDSTETASSDSTTTGSTTTSATSDTTPPTTVIKPPSNCTTVNASNFRCEGTTATFSFSAAETAHLIYGTASQAQNSQGKTALLPSQVTVSSTVGTTETLAFYGVDQSSNAESMRTLDVTFQDTTAPTVSYSIASKSGSGSTCSEASGTFTCNGPTEVTIQANESATIFYAQQVGSAATVSTSSTSGASPLTLTISANQTYITFMAQDPSGNVSASTQVYFKFSGVSANVNSGFFRTDPSLRFSLGTQRDLSTYQLHYLKNSDPKTAIGAVYDNSFVPNGSAVEYLDRYSSCVQDLNAEAVPVNQTAGATRINQFSANIRYGGTQSPSTCSVNGAKADEPLDLVVVMDQDRPRPLALPPSSGSLTKQITVDAIILDPGYEKLQHTAATNGALKSAFTAPKPSATSCKPPTNLTYGTKDFWDACFNLKTGLVEGTGVTLLGDRHLALQALDGAGNRNKCFAGQLNCEASPNGGDYLPNLIEYYTPGYLESGYYAYSEFNTNSGYNYHFGHAAAVGDLDGDGYANDLAIGAPALMADAGDSSDAAKGAVYVWYDNFRERAKREFSLGALSIDVSNSILSFSADGNLTYKVYLNPSAAAYTGAASEYRALPDDLPDATAAKAKQIATVLNKAFLSSLGTAYQLNLFATARETETAGLVTVGHVNRNLKGQFTNGGTNAPGDFASPHLVRAYDYVIYGENNGDEFGYSVAIGPVDTGTTGVSASSLIVGAPGAATNQGAVYVLPMAATAATAGYAQVALASSLATAAVKITGSTASAGRFGHALLLEHTTNASQRDLFVSAPFLNDSGTARGAVYQFNAQDYAPGTNLAVGTNEADSLTGATDNLLFGYSMVAGLARPQGTGAAKYLYLGAPGNGSNAVPSQVGYALLDKSAAASLPSTYFVYEDPEGGLANRFGYALELSDAYFDNSGGEMCPCLVVGAPGAAGTKGRAYVIGKNGTIAWAQGTSTGDRLGRSIHSGQIGSTEVFETLFVGADTPLKVGRVYSLRRQTISANRLLAFDKSWTGALNGNHLGSTLLTFPASYDPATGISLKVLLMGLEGESQITDSYYPADLGGNYRRDGKVRIYSAARLGY